MDELPSSIYKLVGAAIAERRKRLSPPLTQQQLAERTDQLSRSAVANMERGRQRVALHHLYVLAEALDCDPGDLLPSIEEIAESAQVELPNDQSGPTTEWLKRVLRHDRASTGGGRKR